MTARVELASPAGTLARALAADLGRHGITSQISECEGIAVVGIWAVRLAVWCEWAPGGWRFRWCQNDPPPVRGRWDYTLCPCSAMETAVHRLVRFYGERHKRIYGTAPVVGGEDPS
ncbi:hypothetical protein [Nonomuraea sp. NPDC049400]|uniref:hypothetical protein n=1 Tax=Nonomuraea sp. NPDC049400 TaxID=3364352 RepID=UPI003798D40F